MSRMVPDPNARPKDCAPEAENLRFARKAIWSVFAGLAAVVFTALAISPLQPELLGEYITGFWEWVAADFDLWILLAIACGLTAINLGKGWRNHSDTYNRSLARLGTILGVTATATSTGWVLIIFCGKGPMTLPM